MKTIKTFWEVWKYEVYEINGIDGSEWFVNDRYCIARKYPIILRVKVANPGTDNEFQYAEISDYKIGQIFGTYSRLDITGDDVNYYIDRKRDGCPIGEMQCLSHLSLSPIKSKERTK